ncbi:hypothetical protein [Rubripirellula reticaptiva]|uniref:Uncharacterized protein n=1 Tax=Rubripirellula reticaptiva TaxID=2528013 RepID=A0A5C6EF93_9BACT|nr:hypothetical protein [Rubripirellula reticaptiva]TWU48453.1 hypothetical protein Poly59_53010 [Rubripirellula reticaptiva]
MNLTLAPVSQTRPTVEAKPASSVSAPAKSAPTKPALADVVAAIIGDAGSNSLKYVLRSNTHHDGE